MSASGRVFCFLPDRGPVECAELRISLFGFVGFCRINADAHVVPAGLAGDRIRVGKMLAIFIRWQLFTDDVVQQKSLLGFIGIFIQTPGTGWPCQSRSRSRPCRVRWLPNNDTGNAPCRAWIPPTSSHRLRCRLRVRFSDSHINSCRYESGATRHSANPRSDTWPWDAG